MAYDNISNDLEGIHAKYEQIKTEMKTKQEALGGAQAELDIWKCWSRDYLHSLQQRAKWTVPSRNVVRMENEQPYG